MRFLYQKTPQWITPQKQLNTTTHNTQHNNTKHITHNTQHTKNHKAKLRKCTQNETHNTRQENTIQKKAIQGK